MDELPAFVAFDCNALICLTGPDCDDKIRLVHLFSSIDKRKGQAIIPTPALAEYLILADQAGLEFVQAFDKRAAVKVAEFDIAAAFEAAQMHAAAIGRGDKRDGSSEAWQKVKYDTQIVAIAKANGARLMVSNDAGVRACAARINLKVMRSDELPFPDAARQHALQMEGGEVAE
ncbi:PIN domain nuclease [Xanthomonas maliensis]|uniref:PIN domain nuclease n=2 Tax=Xanthomonas maliensis TaxID=1321368 RepID=UPI001264848A|nr:PIN domain nuclease [Xanthomonas maliensis]KAB7767614.1 PIN domain nuclease [Xanthomonas maliensis]